MKNVPSKVNREGGGNANSSDHTVIHGHDGEEEEDDDDACSISSLSTVKASNVDQSLYACCCRQWKSQLYSYAKYYPTMNNNNNNNNIKLAAAAVVLVACFPMEEFRRISAEIVELIGHISVEGISRFAIATTCLCYIVYTLLNNELVVALQLHDGAQIVFQQNRLDVDNDSRTSTEESDASSDLAEEE